MTTKTTKPAKTEGAAILINAAEARALSEAALQQRIDMNDPTKSGAEAVADALKAQ